MVNIVRSPRLLSGLARPPEGVQFFDVGRAPGFLTGLVEHCRNTFEQWAIGSGLAEPIYSTPNFEKLPGDLIQLLAYVYLIGGLSDHYQSLTPQEVQVRVDRLMALREQTEDAPSIDTLMALLDLPDVRGFRQRIARELGMTAYFPFLNIRK